ncbi:MAG: hypothetical protein IPL15_06855 [Comamonadaceae bacterium]|uniref:hypothetical protein n=1 Tax=Candidatus Skiveiella danica TaxID=3386177 RepID=UPI00390A8DE9|nr:hypothetical protein [Comamonadaceae bacterium]
MIPESNLSSGGCTLKTAERTIPKSPEAPSTYSAFIHEELRRYDEHIRILCGVVPVRARSLRIIGLLLEGKSKGRGVGFCPDTA